MLFTADQVDSALDLMQHNELSTLEQQDFSGTGGKKMSWQELAQSCIRFLATHLLQLQSIQETKERADLLLHRLHARRSQGVRTTLPTQSAIELIHHVSSMMTEIAKMKSGELVSDIDASLARASVLKARFLSLRQLAPGVKPRIEELTRVVKDAIESLLRRQVVQQGRRNLAQRALSNWTGEVLQEISGPPGVQIAWDSD